MKKPFFAVVAGIVLGAAVFTGYKVYENRTMTPQESLTKQNIETLTDCEITRGDKVKLSCKGTSTCSETYMGHTLTCDGTKQ